MVYGYVRISTPKQNPERQVRNIKAAYPYAIILQETYTGTASERKEWSRLIAKVKDGDTIVFDSVSRMSRSADEGIEIYMKLHDRKVDLVFLKEPHINTATYKKAMQNSVPLTGTSVDMILEGVNAYLLALAEEQIRLAFEQSEKEVMDLRQRTREGIETARLHGKQIGQRTGNTWETKKSIAAKDIIKKHSRHFDGTLADKDVMILAGISSNSYYKYKRELREMLSMQA